MGQCGVFVGGHVYLKSVPLLRDDVCTTTTMYYVLPKTLLVLLVKCSYNAEMLRSTTIRLSFAGTAVRCHRSAVVFVVPQTLGWIRHKVRDNGEPRSHWPGGCQIEKDHRTKQSRCSWSQIQRATCQCDRAPQPLYHCTVPPVEAPPALPYLQHPTLPACLVPPSNPAKESSARCSPTRLALQRRFGLLSPPGWLSLSLIPVPKPMDKNHPPVHLLKPSPNLSHARPRNAHLHPDHCLRIYFTTRRPSCVKHTINTTSQSFCAWILVPSPASSSSLSSSYDFDDQRTHSYILNPYQSSQDNPHGPHARRPARSQDGSNAAGSRPHDYVWVYVAPTSVE